MSAVSEPASSDCGRTPPSAREQHTAVAAARATEDAGISHALPQARGGRAPHRSAGPAWDSPSEVSRDGQDGVPNGAVATVANLFRAAACRVSVPHAPADGHGQAHPSSTLKGQFPALRSERPCPRTRETYWPSIARCRQFQPSPRRRPRLPVIALRRSTDPAFRPGFCWTVTNFMHQGGVTDHLVSHGIISNPPPRDFGGRCAVL